MTENIRKFLATAYSDEKLAALLAHTESGRLTLFSCCCLVGCATADHPLQVRMDWTMDLDAPAHLAEARALNFAYWAEREFRDLGDTDGMRRRRLLPLIHAEIARRDTENWKAAQEEEVLTGAQ